MMNMKRLAELFKTIKANTNVFGGDKTLYRDAMKAYYAIKFNNVDLAKAYGFDFAKKYTYDNPYPDATGTIKEFSAIVEHAHRSMAAAA